MALAAVKTFVAGEPLFASDLNEMNTNILANGLALISPLQNTIDANEESITDIGSLAFFDGGTSAGTGSLQRNGIALTFYDGVRTQVLQNTLLFNHTAVGNVGAGEDTLMTMSLEASFLASTSRCIRILGVFAFAANANTKTLKFYLGSSNITLNDATTAPNDVLAVVDLYLFRPSASHQTVRGSYAMTGMTESMPVAAWTETETNALTLKFTGESGAAATDDIIQQAMWVTLIK